jgi:hypothetical protein
MTKPETLNVPVDFSLVLGGPLFQLFRKAHLSGDALEMVRRRVVVLAGLAWLPLLLLSLIAGHALGGAIKVPFLYDIEAHVRFLIALPTLVVAELIVHTRIRPTVKSFIARRIIVPEDMTRFDAAIDSAMRVRNSVTVEIALLILVYTLGLWIWRSNIATGAASWYTIPDGTNLRLTFAGYWYAFVSIPIFGSGLLRIAGQSPKNNIQVRCYDAVSVRSGLTSAQTLASPTQPNPMPVKRKDRPCGNIVARWRRLNAPSI